MNSGANPHVPELAPLQSFVERRGFDVNLSRLLVPGSVQRPSALCYTVADGRVLMIRRKKEPFTGRFTAPGGKIEPGEDPEEAVRRELREETAITVASPRLAMITSETGPVGYNWLLFIFTASRFEGEPRMGESEEGEVAWVEVGRLQGDEVPEVDRALFPYLLGSGSGGMYVARIMYSAGREVAALTVKRVGKRLG